MAFVADVGEFGMGPKRICLNEQKTERTQTTAYWVAQSAVYFALTAPEAVQADCDVTGLFEFEGVSPEIGETTLLFHGGMPSGLMRQIAREMGAHGGVAPTRFFALFPDGQHWFENSLERLMDSVEKISPAKPVMLFDLLKLGRALGSRLPSPAVTVTEA